MLRIEEKKDKKKFKKNYYFFKAQTETQVMLAANSQSAIHYNTV